MAVYDFECCHLPDERFVREERFVLRQKLTTDPSGILPAQNT